MTNIDFHLNDGLRKKKGVLESWILWVILTIGGSLFAQVGSPFVRNFPPPSYHSSAYTSSPKNYGIDQDRIGTVFVANQNNLLSYNGKRWAQVDGGANMSFLKMAQDRHGRIYSGGTGDLGWIGADSLGKLHFESLLDMVPSEARSFVKILNVVADDEGHIFFMDNTWLMKWDGATMQAWKSKAAFRKAFEVGGKVFVQSKDDGLYCANAAQLQQIDPLRLLDTLNVKGVHRLGDENSIDFLLITRTQGLFTFDGKALFHIPTALDSLSIWNTFDLQNGSIALATEGHGLGILDKHNRSVEMINDDQGLYFNALHFIDGSHEGGLWAASYMGVNRVEYPARLRKILLPKQSRMMVHSMIAHGSVYFLGLVDGCAILKRGQNGPEIKKLEGVRDLVKGVLPWKDGLVIASAADGIFWWRDHVLTNISETKATFILRSRTDTTTLFVGSEAGLSLLHWRSSQWIDDYPINRLNHSVYDIEETPQGELWAGRFSISRLHYPNGLGSQPTVTTFDSTQGFTEDHGEYDLFQYEGKLYFGTNRGIFRFDEAQQRLVPDATFGERFADHGHAAYYMVQDLLGQIWLYDGERTGFLRKDKTGQWQWNDLPLRRMEDQEVWSIYPSPDSLIWIGTTTTLYCYDPRIPKDYHVPYHTLIDRVTVNDTSVVFYGNYADARGLITDTQPDNYKLTFPFERNNLAFSYTATSYEYPEKTVFSHWLEGLEDDWSPWGPESDKAYNDLPEGTYTFHARSKNLYDTLGKEAAYTFTILPPWYRTWWAYLIYICAAIGSVVLIVRWQVGRANRKQESARMRERKQERAIMQATLETQETERMRIARDLHDEVGAMLSTVKMSIKHSQRQLAKDGIPTTLDESTGLLDAVIGSVREISHDLLPPSLESLGLAEALSGLAEQTAHMSGIPFDCTLQGAPCRLPIRRELAIYRVVQELISNSLKHSQATRRDLRLRFDAQTLRIVFEDNGVGFDYAAVIQKSEGLGLRGMASRTEALGGTLQLRSAPGEGFFAEIVLPVDLS